MNKKLKQNIHDWIWIVLLIFCVVGLIYPIVGLVAIICMVAPVIYSAFLSSRGYCGAYCPRGSLNDKILGKISRNKKIPKILKNETFRIIVLLLIMTFFTIQLALSWGDINAIGMVFVRMIIITSLITIILGVIYKPRSWCTFCPMGTMAKIIVSLKQKKKEDTFIIFEEGKCINCRRCSNNCPMEIDVLSYKEEGYVKNPDCIRCDICISICPKDALSKGELCSCYEEAVTYNNN